MKHFLTVSLLVAGLLCAPSFSVYMRSQSAVKPNKTEIISDQEVKNLDGVVEVSFKIDGSGKVQILNIVSTSPQLSDYVIKKLDKIQLDQNNTEIGKVIKYRFVFKKQA
jgi:hypothetical protein